MMTYICAYRTSRRQVTADPHQPAFWRKQKALRLPRGRHKTNIEETNVLDVTIVKCKRDKATDSTSVAYLLEQIRPYSPCSSHFGNL